jgi:uncharacterized Zn-binding protein involved in type VI secretion
MSRPASKQGSLLPDGEVLVCEHGNRVLINGVPATHIGTPAVCHKRSHGKVIIAEGLPTVLVHGMPISGLGHKASCGCPIVNNLSPNVRIG